MNLINQYLKTLSAIAFCTLACLPGGAAQTSQDSTFSCNDLIHISVNGDCEALISADEIVEGFNGNWDDFTVVLTDQNGFPVPNPVTGTYLGETITITAIFTPTGNSCWGEATIEDKWLPAIICTDLTVPCFFNFNNSLFPTATDNCDPNPSVVLTGTVINNSNLCSGVIVTRTFFAYDDSGNASVPCIQTLTTAPPPLPDFPEDTIWSCEIYEPHPNVINATQLTGNLNTTGSGVPDVAIGPYCPYTVTFTDLTLDGCGATFAIVRTWVVLDWCSGQVIVSDINGDDNVQLIRVKDFTPPLITMPPFTIGANVTGNYPGGCTAVNFIPPATVSDNCHSFTFKILTPVGEANYINGQNGAQGGIIPFPGLPLGVHLITYEAIDVCGNVSSLQVPVTVADLYAPVTVCDEITTVSLDNLGNAEILGSVLDDGSHDNCCLDTFLVRRMTTSCDSSDLVFNDKISLCCEDVGDSVTVVFRAFDCAGNHNDCMVTILVEDKIAPALISCPPAQTISCDTFALQLEIPLSQGNFSVLNQFGAPVFQDNCQLVWLDTTVTLNIDQCLQGTILRKWQVTDPGNNLTLTCNQTIFVQNISDWVVEFPADLTVTCTQTIPPTGEPEIFFETCELVATTFSDQIFTVVPDVCFKIVRTWTTINWCAVGTNIDDEVIESPESVLNIDLNGDGVKNDHTFQDGLNAANLNLNAPLRGAHPDGNIRYQQTIKVVDNMDPVVTCLPQINVCIFEQDCKTTFSLPLPEAEDCNETLTFSASGTLGSGLGPFTDVPPGIYPMTYSVDDGCNNVGTCQTTVLVRDCKPPTAYCLNGLSVTLEQDGSVTIEAEDLDAGSFDNCSDTLNLSFTPNITDSLLELTCFSIGFVTVQIWVTDEAGNQDFCETFIFVDDNTGACQGLPLVGGSVTTPNNLPVKGVHVGVNGTTQMMVVTGSDGQFEFEVPSGGDYTMLPVKDTFVLNGVTTFDLVLISKHILDIDLLDTPYQMIAADANHTNTITTADLVAIRKVILQQSSTFPNNTSWRFVAKNFVFPNPLNPFETPFPELLNFNNLEEDVLNASFTGIKIGDVSGNVNPQL